MWTIFRRLLIPVFSLTLAAGGLAYAGVQHEVFTASSRSEGSTLGADDQGGADLEDGQDPTGSSHQTGTARSTEGCDGFTGNHGQFVSQAEGSRSDAAHSPCGKPLQAVTHHPTSQTTEPADDNEAEGPEDDNESEVSGPNEHSNGHANEHAGSNNPGHGEGHEDQDEDSD